jgi:hypothetical protein
VSLKNSLRQAAQFIEKLEVNDAPAGDPLKEPPQVWFSQGKSGLMLWGHEATEYAECVHGLYSAVGQDGHVSLKAVENALQVAIVEALDSEKEQDSRTFTQRLEDAITQLNSALQASPTSWRFYYRVEGLALTGLPFELGRVRFFIGDKDAGLSSVVGHAGERVDEQLGASDKANGIRSGFTTVSG